MVFIITRAIRLLNQANKTILLNKRFCYVLFYLVLKIFKKYSKIKQQDRNKYWANFRQLVSIIASLLIKDNSVVFQYI